MASETPTTNGTSSVPHPLRPLTEDELLKARQVVIDQHGGEGVTFLFRSVFALEPKKQDLVDFLMAEHGGDPESSKTIVMPREVYLEYDIIKDGQSKLTETVVNVETGTLKETKQFEPHCQTAFIGAEFAEFYDACVSSDMWKEAIAEFDIPDNFKISIDPWPYGGLEQHETAPRWMIGLVYAQDSAKEHPDSNHYSYPIPIIPVMDFQTKKLIRVDRLATGGKGDALYAEPLEAGKKKKLFEKNTPAEYVPELLGGPLRTDLKPINITQPEGASFKVHDDHFVEWSNWRFRVGFTPREGAVLHDVCYNNRPIMYRLSFSEMAVPYGDPRPPFQRKQAFDFGDGGIGRNANNLQLGCDCLGAIHYLNCVSPAPDGKPTTAKNVVCLHEQDNGIGWKHTNFRTDRAVVSRLREFVIQFVATLANYEYVFAYKLDTAGGISVEVRATGIVSTTAIDEGKLSDYGNVVSPGVLAQNHQHMFAVRIDPSMDSYGDGDTSVVLEETHPMPMNPETNPFGNGYEVRREVVEKARWADAKPEFNRVVRLENKHKKNPVSGKNVGYKLTPAPTQLMLADENSVQAKRAPFAKHHLWVTGYRDGEFWAGGQFTIQSQQEEGGVQDMVKRGDWFSDEVAAEGEANGGGEGRKSSPVLWSVFGLTHNPRVEDWPVMPVEIHQVHIRPADFFDRNPALEIPGDANKTSVLVPSSSAAAAATASACCSSSGNNNDDDEGSKKKEDETAAAPQVENGGGDKSKKRLSLSNLLSFSSKK